MSEIKIKKPEWIEVHCHVRRPSSKEGSVRVPAQPDNLPTVVLQHLNNKKINIKNIVFI
jgi:hypothetical protein